MEPLSENDPETIGPYRLFALLGRGGWGSVYFARSEFGRGVALKTIRPEHLARNPKNFRSRFAREVEAARAVDSAYTAEVVDADTSAAEPWLATRYIRGVDLAEALDHCGTPLPERAWRVLATGLADALRSIHASDLVHRDLKLANILLAGDGPYVIDFGIARNVSPADVTLTGSGASPRTETFSSPEQLKEEPGVGPASDIFSLGLVLAYAALNRHPFGPGSATQIGANILHGRRQLAGLPPTVEKVVLPCLEPTPQNRPTPEELTRLLPPSVSPKEQEWLPPGLRRALAGLSDLAVDLAEPMRYRWPEQEPPSRPGPGAGRPPAAGTSPAARPARERDFPPAPPGPSVHEATTQSATNAGPVHRVPVQTAPKTEPSPRPPATPTDEAAAAKGSAGGPGSQYRAAAEAGSSHAMRRLGTAYRTVRDWREALHWYLRSAESGNPTGALEAAQLIEQHFPERQDQVVSLHRRAAEGGLVDSAMRLGELLEQEPDELPEALEWYEKAAAWKHEKAPEAVARVRAALARAQVSGADDALMREHEVAARHGQVNSMLALASWHQRAKREQEALAWYQCAAEAGHTHAMVMTAQILVKDPNQQAQSLDWYRRAAAADNTTAQHWMGRWHRGEGRLTEALAHLRAAADKGLLGAMTDTADILEQTGRGQEALKWYLRAAEKGFPKAPLEVRRLRAALADAGPATSTSTSTSTPTPTSTSTSTASEPASAGPVPTKAAGRTAPNPTVGRGETGRSKSAAPKTTTPPGRKPEAPTAAGQPDPASLRATAMEHETSGRLEDALRCLLQAEELHDHTVRWDAARLCLALRDRTDRPGERKQLMRQAIGLYRALAEAGESEAMLALVGLDSAHSFDWRLRAAEAGNPQAMRSVARAQLKAGSDEHVQAALSWLRRAGEAGEAAAILDGARAHERRGAYGEAIGWYRWADENGVVGAAAEAARVTAEHPGAARLHRWSELLERLRRSLG
ncbi:protein kinase [Kitasatospora sp. NBC_00085]|uniref:protein kinase domain-containing protein n=1 Tax=Kitasatospora sp. NBC_00085 TaxID=2903566 RepID=UPI00324BF658